MGDRVVLGGKGLTISTGMHVPLIANWRGKAPSGRTSGDLVDSTDLLPTMCEAAGIKVGDTLTLTHGFPSGGNMAGTHEHKEYQYTVVGILKPTG